MRAVTFRILAVAVLLSVPILLTAGPSLQVPGPISVEAASAGGATVSYTVYVNGTASGDDENGRPINPTAASCSPSSGSLFALGTTTVQCTATDASGTTTGTFEVSVVDTTAPELFIPRDMIVSATTAEGAVVSYQTEANDVVSGPVSVSCTPPSGSVFAVGSTAVTCVSSDLHGNQTAGGFTVIVIAPDDPPPPVTIEVPDPITAEATEPGGAVVTYTARSSNGGDDENGRPLGQVSCNPASGSLFALGTTTVNCTAGTATASFVITVEDTTAPELSLPADIVTNATTPGGAVVTFLGTAFDLVSGSVGVTCNPASGSTFPAGTTTVLCSASDGSGNDAAGEFTVTVNQGNEPLVVTLAATPDTLWPPNHQMVPVTISVSVTGATTWTAQIVSVSSNQADDGHTSPDWEITGPLTVNLRSEKNDGAGDRVYTVVVEVADEDGDHATASVNVEVTNASDAAFALPTDGKPSGSSGKRKGRS